jgi:predicted nuclease of predicted toxin-antitoxin system
VSEVVQKGFLIDEDLSSELIAVAKARGFLARAVNKIVKLRGKDDGAVVRYAIANDLILVTRNKIDHAAIYAIRDCHPGVVFFVAGHPKLNKKQFRKSLTKNPFKRQSQ